MNPLKWAVPIMVGAAALNLGGFLASGFLDTGFNPLLAIIAVLLLACASLTRSLDKALEVIEQQNDALDAQQDMIRDMSVLLGIGKGIDE